VVAHVISAGGPTLYRHYPCWYLFGLKEAACLGRLIPIASKQELEQLGLADYYIVDTFSSDYDAYFDEFGAVFDAHGPRLDPRLDQSRALLVWGKFVILLLRLLIRL
jgi:hypothetical protein